MKELFKNPHTFDMNAYYTGQVFVLGGRDFEREEKELQPKTDTGNKDFHRPIKLDWSFLNRPSKKK